MLIENNPQWLMIHHSLTWDGKTVSWDAIREWHMGINKDSTNPYVLHPMRDIGYNFGVELIGDHYEILFGRPLWMEGGHCPDLDMNRKSLSVCVIGDFTLSAPPKEQLICLVRGVIAPLILYTHWPLTKLIFHREANPTRECPGIAFEKGYLIQVIREVMS
jgi:hypothetical protein